MGAAITCGILRRFIQDNIDAIVVIFKLARRGSYSLAEVNCNKEYPAVGYGAIG